MPLRQQQLARDDAWQMLQFIPADDRDIWVKGGMAIKSGFGDSGFSLFDEWSQAGVNYDPKAVISVWRSFKSGSVTIGTLFHLAAENGWRSNQKNDKPLPRITPAPKPMKTNTAAYAKRLWLAANKWEQTENWLSLESPDVCVISHQYAIDKGIDSAGGAGRGIASGSKIGKQSDCIIIPVRGIETNQVQSVQCINPQGVKQNFGPISGGALVLGNTLDKSLVWYVCEGWATAYSTVFHHQKGNGVCAAAFGKSNLDKVANLIAKIHKPEEITILQEDDS
jgi:putative DNA primase/helicase